MTTAALDQKMVALSEANRIRAARATIKRRWKRIDPRAARREMCEWIQSPPPDLVTWRVETALMALPYVGRVKVRRWLLESGVPLSKTLGGMSERQRAELVAKVGS